MTAKKSAKAKSAKKPAKKPAPKAAKPKAKAAAKPAPKKEAPKKEAPAKKAPEAKPPAAKSPPGSKARKKAAAAKPITARGEAKPGLGYKWVCFSCSAKFYDLGKPEPVCPRCGSDQRERPASDSPPSAPTPRRPAQPPMARYLEEEDAPPAEGEAFVDEGEEEAAELDIEAIEETGAFVEPDYEDE
jgi:hypothetical protein